MGDLAPLQLALLGGGTDRAPAVPSPRRSPRRSPRCAPPGRSGSSTGRCARPAIPHDLASDLDRAVDDAAGRGHSPQSMSADPRVRRLISAAFGGLVEDGLLLGPRERRLVREVTIPVFVTAAAGLVIGLSAFGYGHPATGVTILEAAGVAAAAGLLFLRVDRLPAGSRAVPARAPSAGPEALCG